MTPCLLAAPRSPPTSSGHSRIIKPPERISISEWAAKHARLKDGSRYHPWPFQIEILDTLGDPRTKKGVVPGNRPVLATRRYCSPTLDIAGRTTLAIFCWLVRQSRTPRSSMKEHVAAAFSWPIMKLNGLFSTRNSARHAYGEVFSRRLPSRGSVRIHLVASATTMPMQSSRMRSTVGP